MSAASFMDSTIPDAVIIGGGPAGSCAARLLASWGRAVVLLTRPAGAALAESLPPSCSRLFDRIGISDDVEAAGFVRTTGNTVWWGEAEGRSEYFPDGQRGWQVERGRFDGILLDAAESAGARIDRSANVREVVPAGASAPAASAAGMTGGWLVVYHDSAGEERSVHARWVLDCTGRSGLVARRGWRRNEPGGRTLGLVAFWERPSGWDVPDPTHTLVWSHSGGWIWSVPVSATRRCVAVMIDPSRTRLEGRAGMESLYSSEIRAVPRLAHVLADAARASGVQAHDASPYGAHRVSDDGQLVVGDAASFVDPLSSFGVKKAMASAWLAAVVANTALQEPGCGAAARELYEARERAMYDALCRRHAELSAEAAAGLPHGFWNDRAGAGGDGSVDEPDVAVLRSDPRILEAFADLRARPAIRLKAADGVRRMGRPVVSGNRIILADHIRCPAFPAGIRWIRDVDLVTLTDMAPAHEQVPDLYEAYNRAAPPVPLPDFLGALALLLGMGILEHA